MRRATRGDRPWCVVPARLTAASCRRAAVTRAVLGAAIAVGVCSPGSPADQFGNTPAGIVEGHPALARSPRHATTAHGRPLWLGAATFDERVEVSRTTGGFTHKIGPNIDRERDKLLADAMSADALDGYYWVDDFHPDAEGRNGGGDPYFTDRRLAIGVIVPVRR